MLAMDKRKPDSVSRAQQVGGDRAVSEDGLLLVVRHGDHDERSEWASWLQVASHAGGGQA